MWEEWYVCNEFLVGKLISVCALYDAIQHQHSAVCFTERVGDDYSLIHAWQSMEVQ